MSSHLHVLHMVRQILPDLYDFPVTVTVSHSRAKPLSPVGTNIPCPSQYQVCS